MRLHFIALVAAAAFAQEPAPIGLVRGSLLELEQTGGSGELSLRSADSRVFRFFFDSRTYFERAKQPVLPARLAPGESLEILADTGAGSTLRYARTIRVIVEEREPRPLSSLGRVRAYRSVTEHIVPRGSLTFSGVVTRFNDERMLLKTRLEGEKTILLRQDTRYVEGGSLVEAASLKANIRVFVRAGRNLDNEIEAYQVVWGEILSPAR